MKYLHIFYNDKFADPYIDFINDNFNAKEHLFIFFGGVSEDKIRITERDNVYKLTKSLKGFLYLMKAFYKSEKIIIHSLYNKLLVVLLYLQPWLLSKSNWIVWGGDLYYYKSKKNTLITYLYEALRGKVIKNINGVATLVKGDYDLVKEWYDTKAKYYKAIYMSEERTEYIKIISESVSNGDVVFIQVGNSASPSNNHLEIIDLLEKFKSENIKIFCPLSYGDAEYAEKVIAYGKEKYGEKFIPLKKLLSMSEYMDYLHTIDIGIFNNDRQQALGNIYSLLCLGKKVYMREDTSMWKELKHELKLKVYSIAELEKEDFNSVIYQDSVYREKNKKILEVRYDSENIKKIWHDIFE
jgi:hypothetical protein